MNYSKTLSRHTASLKVLHADEVGCSRCLSARAQERRLIARELHDELGQQLTALLQGLGVLRIKLERDRPELGPLIRDLVSISHSAITATRDISVGIPTGSLRRALVPALHQLIEDFRRQSGIDCRLDLPIQEINLEPHRSAHLYRIVQESLTNVLRHAEASRVAIILERRENDYVLEIADDGKGFALHDTRPDSSGLSGMRERGRQLGGPVIIFSHPGHGTIVQAILPITLSRKP
ncbi:histidine kinase [Ectopseudomonas composti]|uniref:Histidine kinase n=1 Tax=Ectopseudomonas composti TaxID=658457 RepID=A0ABN0SCS7_9GAMM|nr:histidine kinase [Pseudomonas composti]